MTLLNSITDKINAADLVYIMCIKSATHAVQPNSLEICGEEVEGKTDVIET